MRVNHKDFIFRVQQEVLNTNIADLKIHKRRGHDIITDGGFLIFIILYNILFS